MHTCTHRKKSNTHPTENCFSLYDNHSMTQWPFPLVCYVRTYVHTYSIYCTIVQYVLYVCTIYYTHATSQPCSFHPPAAGWLTQTSPSLLPCLPFLPWSWQRVACHCTLACWGELMQGDEKEHHINIQRAIKWLTKQTVQHTHTHVGRKLIITMHPSWNRVPWNWQTL